MDNELSEIRALQEEFARNQVKIDEKIAAQNEKFNSFLNEIREIRIMIEEVLKQARDL